MIPKLEVRIVLDRFPTLPREVQQRAAMIVQKAGLDVEGRAKSRAPVRTGYLKNSIQARMESEMSSLIAVGADYGIYVEMGTRHMAARPYFTPAFEEVKSQFLEAMRDVIR